MFDLIVKDGTLPDGTVFDESQRFAVEPAATNRYTVFGLIAAAVIDRQQNVAVGQIVSLGTSG